MLIQLLRPLVPLPPGDGLPGPLCWPLLLVHPEVHTTSIAHRGAHAVLPPRGGGGGEAVGTVEQGGDGKVWGLRTLFQDNIGLVLNIDYWCSWR